LLLAKGGILPHYDRTMIAITEEIIEEILAFGTDPKAMAFPINRRALHKYYHHRCCCGKTVGEGLKACFGLTEASIDNNGTPIVLHVLPEQSDEDSAALWESVVAWVLSHPEFWHRTAKAIARDYQDVDYGLVVTQGVFIVKRQIDGVDMERAKVESFTRAVVDFLVASPQYMALADKGALFEVLKSPANPRRRRMRLLSPRRMSLLSGVMGLGPSWTMHWVGPNRNPTFHMSS
jgi:hypothetical protein